MLVKERLAHIKSQRPGYGLPCCNSDGRVSEDVNEGGEGARKDVGYKDATESKKKK